MNANGKSVDKTYLSIDQAEDRGFIHRDYIAHCLRWTHVLKRLYERKAYQTARILDIGCGRELPLAKTLYSSKLLPAIYYGVDVGPINDEDVAKIAKTQKFPHKIWERTNFLELEIQDLFDGFVPAQATSAANLPNIVTCMEVLEHVEPKMMFDMLEHMKPLTSDDCRYFISTPCWNRTDCAANHVNEMLFDSLGAAFERHGFVVENVYGTFASIRDYESKLEGWVYNEYSPRIQIQAGMKAVMVRQIFDELREYYDTNFLSCVFAPLFPAQSRNCLWELRKYRENLPSREQISESQPKFPPIESIQKPWSSSERWADMAL